MTRCAEAQSAQLALCVQRGKPQVLLISYRGVVYRGVRIICRFSCSIIIAVFALKLVKFAFVFTLIDMNNF